MLFLPFRTLREPEDRVRWVRGMIAALCQPRGRGHHRAFIKFTSTNVRCHDIIRAAFPDVPCLFLYRHPVEVLVSFLKDPPGWMGIKAEPGIAEAMLRMLGAELDGASNEEFAARVLGAFYESGLAIAERGTVLDYEQLRPEAMGAIARVFGVDRAKTVTKSRRFVPASKLWLGPRYRPQMPRLCLLPCQKEAKRK